MAQTALSDAHLQVNVPKWTTLIKTSTHKELGPYNDDW